MQRFKLKDHGRHRASEASQLIPLIPLIINFLKHTLGPKVGKSVVSLPRLLPESQHNLLVSSLVILGQHPDAPKVRSGYSQERYNSWEPPVRTREARGLS